MSEVLFSGDGFPPTRTAEQKGIQLFEGAEVAEETTPPQEETVEQEEDGFSPENTDTPAAETEEHPPEDVSEPAQNRYRKLANERRAALKENQELKDLVRALKEDAGLRRQQWDYQQQYIRQQQEAVQPELRKRAMLMAGLDPSETFHQFMYDQWEKNQQLERNVRELHERLQGTEAERHQDRFTRSIESTIKEAAKRYALDSAAVSDLVENAKEIALAKGLSPEDAAKTTLQRVSRFLKPRTAQKVIPAEDTQVHNLISLSGRTGGEEPGPIRRSKPKSFEEALKSLTR